ncbi:SLBB domain-containing protein [Ferrovum myxofaciens]|uniref:SLBB domain-containing protein n=1 Tax=Ferrovum myxofaciens TaxID=416213 RepID=UPI003EC137D8
MSFLLRFILFLGLSTSSLLVWSADPLSNTTDAAAVQADTTAGGQANGTTQATTNPSSNSTSLALDPQNSLAVGNGQQGSRLNGMTCTDQNGRTIPVGNGSQCIDTPNQAKPLAFPQRQQSQNLPIQAPTEFQKFVQAITGKILPMYGYSMFDQAPSTFAPVERIPVSSDYVIGPGDEVDVKVWGQIDADLKLEVDRLGQIYIPKVGSVNVAGIKYQDLQPAIKTAIGHDYRNFDLQVNLGQLRSIQIFVVGQARRPGSYTVSSLSTLVNALFASGGPSATGSLRDIEVKRGAEVVTTFDMYDFLLKGDKTRDIKLQPGDVIYIAPIGPVTAIYGSVNNPAIYELKGDSDLSGLIAMAGGLTTTAAGQKVELERIKNRTDREVQVANLDKSGMALPLRDGDLVKVFAISPKIENAVTLRGNVATPYRYNWHQGLRVTDLIPDKDALVTPNYWLKRSQITAGQVVNLTDIGTQQAQINWDYAVIQRFDPTTLDSTLIPFNLGRAVLDHDPSQNLELQPGDVITVFSINEVKVPVKRQVRLITLEGEVMHPGVYQAEPGETLRQLVNRVGGLTPNAYLFGAEFDRESTRILQQQRLIQTIDRLERDLSKSAAASIQGAMDKTTADTLQQQAQSQKAELEKMRQAKPTGRIVLELTPQSNKLEDIPDIALENGDRLVIPTVTTSVGVMGEVYNENNAYLYQDNRTISDYLSQAGGPTRDADPSRTFMLRANGSVVSSQSNRGLFARSFDHINPAPGDTIVVPEKVDNTPVVKSLIDWSTILFNMGVSLVTLKFMGVI